MVECVANVRLWVTGGYIEKGETVELSQEIFELLEPVGWVSAVNDEVMEDDTDD